MKKAHALLAVAAPAVMATDFAAYRRKLASEAVRYEKREAPDFTKLTDTIHGIGTAFEEYKKANDQALKEAKSSGVTPETRAKLDKLDAELDKLAELKSDIEKLITRAARPNGRGDQPVIAEAAEHRDAFVHWMRNPRDPEREQRLMAAQKALAAKANSKNELERRAAQVVTSTGSAGGFALPEEIERTIARLSVDVSPIRQIATVRTVGTPDYKELFDVNGASFEWLGEGATRNQTTTPDLAEVAPTFGTASARPRASEESLDDLFFNVEQWLATSAGEALGAGEGLAFISGNGTNRPTGFLAGPTPVATADAARAFGTLQFVAGGQAAAMPTTVDPLIDLVYSLRARYRANARWVTAKMTLAALRKYKDTTGQYLWQPSLSQGQPESFMGYPITEAEDMPVVAANAFPIAFGDFREGYLICDRVGLRVTRDEITLPGFVQWYIRRRVGGRLRNTQAIKLLRISV
jgi:HK97 family phage major capsid protein